MNDTGQSVIFGLKVARGILRDDGFFVMLLDFFVPVNQSTQMNIQLSAIIGNSEITQVYLYEFS